MKRFTAERMADGVLITEQCVLAEDYDQLFDVVRTRSARVARLEECLGYLLMIGDCSDRVAWAENKVKAFAILGVPCPLESINCQPELNAGS